MSYNSTGFDRPKILWINELMNTFKIDCFQLQEHFKASKTVEKLFKQEFSKYKCYVSPAVRDQNQEAGRAKGGLAELCLNDLDIIKEKIFTINWRLQAQILHIETYRLLWINCYFPTDPKSLNYDNEELNSVLEEIENILDSNSFDDCILGGDLNYDPSRGSGFANTVRDFMLKIGLVSVWDKFPVQFTHVHTDMKSFSLIDHFFVNERLLEQVEDAGVIHLGDNLSRHSPITMRVNIPDISVKVVEYTPLSRQKPAWYKATDEDREQFKSILCQKLSKLSIPDSLCCEDMCCSNLGHSQDRDFHLLDIMSSIIETSHQCIPMTAKKIQGKNRKSTSRPLPGWKENVAPLKKDSRFWHAIWLSASKPSSGHLHRIMRNTRQKYHHAVRLAKRQAASIPS